MASRKMKYPETDSFVYYNRNPRGRITGDCVFRAFSTALDQDYNQTVMEMAQLMCETGYALNDSKGADRYLQNKGWIKCSQPRKADNTKYTGKEWCKWLSDNYKNGEIGNIVCHIGGHHMVVIKPVDGSRGCYKIHDIWNSSHGCIGNYWVKKR